MSNTDKYTQGQLREPDDSELIALCLKEPEHRAFETIMVRYQDMVFRICFRMLCNEEDALDVAQEVFMTCYRKLHTFSGRSKFSTWLYRLAVNHCKNFWRKEGRSVTTKALSIDQPRSEDDERPLLEVADTNPGPRNRAEQHQLRGIIFDRMALLKPEYREVLILRYAEELKYEEIAEILDCNVGTVKSRLFRAREELRPLLSKALDYAP